jgi:hypothetical protein
MQRFLSFFPVPVQCQFSQPKPRPNKLRHVEPRDEPNRTESTRAARVETECPIYCAAFFISLAGGERERAKAPPPRSAGRKKGKVIKGCNTAAAHTKPSEKRTMVQRKKREWSRRKKIPRGRKVRLRSLLRRFGACRIRLVGVHQARTEARGRAGKVVVLS